MLENVLEPVLINIRTIGEDYGVNPLVFLLLYLGTVPLFWGSLILLVRNIRRRLPLFWPIAGVVVSQIACYTYLVVAGDNLPTWVYVAIAGLILFGLYKSWRYVHSKLAMREVMFR